MMRSRLFRVALSVGLAVVLVCGVVLAVRSTERAGRIHITAYFESTNGLFTGDEVRILGVPVGAIESIEPQAQRARVTFWVDDEYPIPAQARAVIVSPQLVTARAIQLTPAYDSGPKLEDGATIPQDRTAVPLEYDDLRAQLERLTNALQPATPGGVSTVGALVNTAANNLRGEGANIRETVLNVSKALSALGDHSGDTFATIKNLAIVVSALEDSSTVLASLNRNLATVTGLLTDDPGAVGRAIKDLNDVVGDATQFVKDNRETLGTATDKLASISSTVNNSLDDIKQALHVFPNAAANFANVYQPAQGALTGAIALANFADPLRFICGSIAAASRLNGDQSSKLCMQYLAPIVKNRQYNFLPIGGNPIVGAQTRPNEITYSEDRLRPDFVPPAPAGAVAPEPAGLPAEQHSEVAETVLGDTAPDATANDPAAGLPGLMAPTQEGAR